MVETLPILALLLLILALLPLIPGLPQPGASMWREEVRVKPSG